jgi:hypothetical protein
MPGDAETEWDRYPVLIFNNPIDGKRWECQHYEHIGLTPIQTWLLHFWCSTKFKPSLLVQPTVFDQRTAAKSYQPDRASMFKHFQTEWCGVDHTGSQWLNWKDSREVTRQAQKATELFRRNTRYQRESYPAARPLQSGRHIMRTQKVKSKEILKANQRQGVKDKAVREFRQWEFKKSLDRCVHVAIRSGGIAKTDDGRKILALCGEDDAPPGAKRRHRSKFRPTGARKQITRSKQPIARTVSQLLRDFQTEHRPTRMDLKNSDGTHFESGARFDIVTELKQVLIQVEKRDGFQTKSQSRVWTGTIIAFVSILWPFLLNDTCLMVIYTCLMAI